MRPLSAEKDATTYNNYYEFSEQKDLWEAAQALPQRPWTIKLDGMVKQPRTIDIDDLLKQVTLEKKGFGNLCRLPLGRNLKNPLDPTFFLDFRTNYGSQALMPRDALSALTTTNYWK